MDKVVIIGAGALGRFLAARFVAAGIDCVLVGREPGASHLRTHGVLLDTAGEISRVLVPIAIDCHQIAGADIVILCTKAGDLPQALDLAQPLAAGQPAFVTVQNGVEAPSQVEACFPRSAVMGSRIHGFFELDDGVVRHVGVEPSVVFGLTTPFGSERLRQFDTLLSQAGIMHRRSDGIAIELWEKLVLASALGGVGTAMGRKAGEIMQDEQGRAFLEDAMREIAKVAAARGVPLPDDCVERTLAFVAGFPPTATTSMQRDLEARRPSEYDCQVGAVIRLAADAGEDAPVHRRIDAMIRARGINVSSASEEAPSDRPE